MGIDPEEIKYRRLKSMQEQSSVKKEAIGAQHGKMGPRKIKKEDIENHQTTRSISQSKLNIQ